MRRVAAKAVLTLLPLLAACSSSEDVKDAAPGTSPLPSASAGAASSAPASASPGASAAPTGGAVGASPTAAPVSGATSGPRATTAPGRPAPSKATAAGTYVYDSSGSQRTGAYTAPVSGNATLVVSPMSSGRQIATVDNAQGRTRQELLVRDAGSYLADLQVEPKGLPDKEFAFGTAVLLLPDPARVGATWAWHGTSTDGKTTLDARNRVVRTETLTIGGRRVPTVVLQTHLVLGGDLDYTADVTTWVAPALRLPVKDHTVAKGTAVGVPFSLDVTNVMRSTTPS